jgi:hypothetical protein
LKTIIDKTKNGLGKVVDTLQDMVKNLTSIAEE